MSTVTKSPRFSTFLAAAIVIVSPLLTASARANLVVNGDFSAGLSDPFPGFPFGTAAGGGSTDLLNGDLSSWQTGPSMGGGLNVLATNNSAYFGTGALSGPLAGTQVAAVFPNFPAYNGYIAQNVAGVVGGSIYQISFWLANQIGDNANNYMTVNWGGNIASPGASITGGTNLSYTNGVDGPNPTLPGAIPVPTDWTYYSFTVGAPSDNALLSFIGGNSAAGNLIANVDVEFVAVPEVSSFGTVMGLGLLALGSFSRLRRRTFATA